MELILYAYENCSLISIVFIENEKLRQKQLGMSIRTIQTAKPSTEQVIASWQTHTISLYSIQNQSTNYHDKYLCKWKNQLFWEAWWDFKILPAARHWIHGARPIHQGPPPPLPSNWNPKATHPYVVSNVPPLVKIGPADGTTPLKPNVVYTWVSITNEHSLNFNFPKKNQIIYKLYSEFKY